MFLCALLYVSTVYTEMKSHGYVALLVSSYSTVLKEESLPGVLVIFHTTSFEVPRRSSEGMPFQKKP